VKTSSSQYHVKFRQNLTLQQFKVIQGHRSWCQCVNESPYAASY